MKKNLKFTKTLQAWKSASKSNTFQALAKRLGKGTYKILRNGRLEKRKVVLDRPMVSHFANALYLPDIKYSEAFVRELSLSKERVLEEIIGDHLSCSLIDPPGKVQIFSHSIHSKSDPFFIDFNYHRDFFMGKKKEGIFGYLEITRFSDAYSLSELGLSPLNFKNKEVSYYPKKSKIPTNAEKIDFAQLSDRDRLMVPEYAYSISKDVITGNKKLGDSYFDYFGKKLYLTYKINEVTGKREEFKVWKTRASKKGTTKDIKSSHFIKASALVERQIKDRLQERYGDEDPDWLEAEFEKRFEEAIYTDKIGANTVTFKNLFFQITEFELRQEGDGNEFRFLREVALNEILFPNLRYEIEMKMNKNPENQVFNRNNALKMSTYRKLYRLTADYIEKHCVN